MDDIQSITVICVTFIIAGAVKGVIGLGLPTVSLALLTVAFDLPTAMVLLLAPSFLTNMWQALTGGNGRAIWRRLWLFFALAGGTVWIGAAGVTRIDVNWLSGLLGVLLIVYAGVSLCAAGFDLTRAQERWSGPFFGVANGVLTGLTGSFVVPGVMYLQAIGLPRDMLVQAMGALFTVSTLALGLALGTNGFLGEKFGLLSLVAVIPAIAGMVAGQSIRRRIPEHTFRRVFFAALFLLGGYILCSAALS